MNFEVIRNIKRVICLIVECGGGIRDKVIVEFYFFLGIDYIILGFVIFKNFDFVNEVMKVFGKEKFIVFFDFKDGFVKFFGW